jgi:hypothetical protein
MVHVWVDSMYFAVVERRAVGVVVSAVVFSPHRRVSLDWYLLYCLRITKKELTCEGGEGGPCCRSNEFSLEWVHANDLTKGKLDNRPVV